MIPEPRTVVIGARGQVGSALLAQLGTHGVGISRSDANIAVRAELERALNESGPVRALINASAYNNVDGAESDRDLAFAVNADAPGWAAEWAAEHNVPFVHYSTEYVFPDGNGRPWKESDQPVPLNVYGESKLAGEAAVLRAHRTSIVIRTSWVYSNSPNNFVRRVLLLASGGNPLQMVSSQFGSPTYAPDLARATLLMASNQDQNGTESFGILHLAGSGSVSRTEFTREIIRVGVAEGVLSQGVAVEEIETTSYASPARRPVRCVLDCAQADALGITLPPWRESLVSAVQAARS
jgi:dTDP-4-dehydrorhamnose reductase